MLNHRLRGERDDDADIAAIDGKASHRNGAERPLHVFSA